MDQGRDIAIIGMAGRFPGARGLDEFWANLRDGVESVTFFSPEEVLAAGADPEDVARANHVRAGAYMTDLDAFDAEFFGYTAREAETMDPQHRVFLETAWEALEHSGYDPARIAGSVGVFAGAGTNNYIANLHSNPHVVETVGRTQVLLGNELGFLATRVSYKLDLRGPSVSLRTACSTSLVTVHLACRALRDRECNLALSGGVFLNLEQKQGYLHQEGSFLSPDGHCRPFDRAAAGTLFGSGAGVVVLKRLDDALADGDSVYAVVKGSAVNNDGAVKVGFTAPAVAGQARVVGDALRDARVDAAEVDYIEAHGTGTALGDPVEIRALTKAYRGVRRGSVALGSLKSNIGHLDAAAGVAGLIKTVLALRNETLPQTLNIETASPDLGLDEGPFRLQTETTPWRRGSRPRTAGVSAFGFGGTNAHVVVQEAPAEAASDDGPKRQDGSPQLLVLSARSRQALEQLTDAFASRLRRGGASLADIIHTAAVGRHRFPVRRAVTGTDSASIAAALEARNPAQVTTRECGTPATGVVFLLGGQGSQHPGMARELYDGELVFRKAVDACRTELDRAGLDSGFLDLMLGSDTSAETVAALDRTAAAQPALFVVEYALSRLWEAWGIRPAALLGHSLGELVAACLAGTFTLPDALRLVCLRGELMQQQEAGAMLGVVADRKTLSALLPAELSFAAHNGPQDCVVSGPAAAIAAFAEALTDREISAQPVATSHAFHSPLMEPMVARFVAEVAAVPRKPPAIRFVSNVTGTWITDEQAQDPEYWGRHVLAPVEFDAGVRTLTAEPGLVFLEVGPGQTMGSLARRIVGSESRIVTSSLPHRRDRRSPLEALRRALGHLWSAGIEPDWAGLHGHAPRRRVAVPSYPFQRRRYWLDRKSDPVGTPGALRRQEVADWIQAPSWERTVPPSAAPAFAGESWLVLVDGTGFGSMLAERLRAQGAEVTTVAAGSEWSAAAPDHYTVLPGDLRHCERLLHDLRERGITPTSIAHCWNVSGTEYAGLPRQQATRLAFDSLIALARALNGDTDRPECRIWIVANGLHRVTGAEEVMPLKAMLMGPGRVIPREHPGITCRTVDLVLDGPAAVRESVEQLLKEFSVRPAHAAIAYRGPYRWAQTYVAAPLPSAPPQSPVLRADGVYLITGGTGGLGLALAEHLAAPGRRIALLARTALPPEEEWLRVTEQQHGRRAAQGVERLRRVRSLGAEVMVIPADITDRDQVSTAVDRIAARWGAVHGVFHAAGQAGGGLIQLKQAAEDVWVMDPKVRGTLNLEEALTPYDPDFLCLFGSNAANVGDFGLVDYVAANAFLDAYAQSRTPWRRVVTIDWGPWQEAGMAVETSLPEPLAKVRAEDVAQRGMAPAQALDALDRILGSSTEPQLIVSPVDVNVLVETAFTLPSASVGVESDGRIAEYELTGARGPRPDMATPYTPPRGVTEQRLCTAWQEVLGVERVGVQDSFFDLGGSSLVAIQLVPRINSTLGASLTVAQLYEALTVAELARLVDGDGGRQANAVDQTIEQVRDRAAARRAQQQNRASKARARRRSAR
ncbi:type I polyketide synthase [Streptomyces cyaneofuscatus]|uniref:type I polyketide synthase n=1 Tax=Streptomyces cyaneofuscatus TaxID=66883 RepID=UPI0037A3D646